MKQEKQRGEWQDRDTALFLRYGHIFVPEREEWGRTFTDLIPFERDESFVAVEIGAGGGWLSETILTQYPNSKVIALDGSRQMIRHARRRLQSFGDRVEFRLFNLFDYEWYRMFDEKIHCFVSSLVIHHLDGEQKRALFKGLYSVLDPGGALLIADIMKETSEYARIHMGRAWDEETARRSLDFEGNLQAFNQFQKEKWNLFHYPDPAVDKPSTLPEQLGWLQEAGFTGVDAFWVKAGHALFGGYKRGEK